MKGHNPANDLTAAGRHPDCATWNPDRGLTRRYRRASDALLGQTQFRAIAVGADIVRSRYPTFAARETRRREYKRRTTTSTIVTAKERIAVPLTPPPPLADGDGTRPGNSEHNGVNGDERRLGPIREKGNRSCPQI